MHGGHLEFCHLRLTLPSWIQTPCYLLSDSLSHSQTDSIWSNLIPFWIQPLKIQRSWILPLGFTFWTKKTSLIHSHSTWGWQPSWILPSWIQPFCTKKNFTHSFWLYLMVTAILNSAILDSATAILDSDTLLSSLRFTQKHSHSTLTLTQTNSIWLFDSILHKTLTQTNSIWLKLIHSYLTWWWIWICPPWFSHFAHKN